MLALLLKQTAPRTVVVLNADDDYKVYTPDKKYSCLKENSERNLYNDISWIVVEVL